jgi:hypothetical protein
MLGFHYLQGRLFSPYAIFQTQLRVHIYICGVLIV